MTIEQLENRTDTRDRVLDAVDVLLARYGYRKMTLDDIALEAGIARRTIYLHFTGKEGIALQSIDRIVERLIERMRVIAGGHRGSCEKLRKMLLVRISSRLDSVNEYRETLDDILSDLRAAYLERRRGYFEAEATVIAKVLRDGMGEGDFVLADPEETARTMILATNALLPSNLSKAELADRPLIDRQAHSLVELLTAGVCGGTNSVL